jgi:hypothetical protein
MCQIIAQFLIIWYQKAALVYFMALHITVREGGEVNDSRCCQVFILVVCVAVSYMKLNPLPPLSRQVLNIDQK